MASGNSCSCVGRGGPVREPGILRRVAGVVDTAPQTAGGLWAAQPELGSFHAERRLRILAGRPDPNDPSRFTIEYETRRGRGAWDISVRDNPTASPGDNPVVVELVGRPDNHVE